MKPTYHRNFRVAYPAMAQVSRLGKDEKRALVTLFSSRDLLLNPEVTKRMENGQFVSKIFDKRVLWRELPRRRPEIISVVDQSYGPRDE